MEKQPKTHIEKKGSGWRFVMRLNPKKGAFYGLEEPIKLTRQLEASTEQQARLDASDIAYKLRTLQKVAKGDRTTTFSTHEKLLAVEGFLFFHRDYDPRKYVQNKNSIGYVEQSQNKIIEDGFIKQVEDYYRVERYAKVASYTPLGTVLIEALRDNKRPLLGMSDELPTYINKERAIPFSSKAIYDSTRYAHLFENYIGKKPFNLIDRLDVKSYIEHRMKSVSPNSVRRELRSLSAIWNYSKLNADLDIRNPFANHSLPNQPKKNRATAQPAEVQRLYKLIIESDKASYVEHLCLIVLLTGCRLAEAWGLEPTDINEERLAFKIQHNETRRIKNQISTRELPLTPSIHKAITKYLDSTKPNSAASASAALGKFYKSNGFEFSSHSLRHFMRDTLDKLGARASEIDGICGWSSGTMRDQYGNRDLTELLRQRLQAVENHISELNS